MTRNSIAVLMLTAVPLTGLPAQMTPATRPIPVTESVRTTNLGDLALIDATRAYIQTVMRSQSAPGVHIALARRGEIVWEAGFGFADASRQAKMTPETLFHSGSMGKTYTGTAIMQLVEQGVLGLYDPINKYLPFKVTNSLGGREVTIHDLLTHRAGLSGGAGLSLFTIPRPLREALEAEYAKPHDRIGGTLVPRWVAKAGYQYGYSNLGVATLGLIVETSNPEHLSYSAYVEKHIMQPLGMTSSQYPPYQGKDKIRPDLWPRLSTGYATMGKVWIPTATVYVGEYPAGGFIATPGDHLKLLLAMANQGSYHGYQLLKPETVKAMLTPQDAGPGFAGTRAGLIWMLAESDTKVFQFQHGGAHMFGWYNMGQAWPEQGTAIVVAMNEWPLPTITGTVSMIQQFIGRWVADERSTVAATAEPSKQWAWKVSYLRGLLYIEAFNASIGIPTRLSEEEIARLAREAVVDPESNVSWDAEAFVAGARDMNQVEPTREAIQAFAKSGRMRITLEEAERAWRELDPGALVYTSLGGLLKAR